MDTDANSSYWNAAPQSNESVVHFDSNVDRSTPYKKLSEFINSDWQNPQKSRNTHKQKEMLTFILKYTSCIAIIKKYDLDMNNDD